jgi:hypothetical protein
MPEAVSLLAHVGGVEDIIGRLDPKTHIVSLWGQTNLRWTVHRGLVVPLESSGKHPIQVGSE